MAKTAVGKGSLAAGPFVVIIVLSLIAFLLRVVGIAHLSMWGDSSYSVYSANQGLLSIITERIYDGHPPLYYYLLHFWISVVGNSEISVRFLSVFWGVLTVPLAMVVGRRLGGDTLGLVAAVLVTISPELVYYSRLIRMYSLATFLALLSLYLFWLALRRGGWRYWALYLLTTVLALYTHYYAIFLIVAEAAFFLRLLWQRGAKSNLAPWLGTQFVMAALYLPWLVYAGPTQVESTAWIISHAPAAKGLVGFLEQLWVPFNIGVTLETKVATPLSLLFLPLAIVGLLAWWRNRPKASSLIFLLPAAVVIPVVLSYVLFLVFPYAVRPRFLLVYLPVYLILLAWLLLGWRGLHRVLLAVVLVLVVGIQAYSLVDTYYVERHILEPPAIMVTQQLEKLVQSGDAVVFHAAWEIGYFKSHYKGETVTTYELGQVDTIPPPPDLTAHKRVWLAMFSVGRDDPNYPLEKWFDTNWVRVGDWQLDANRLMLYTVAPAGDWQQVTAEFWGLDDQPALQLKGVRFKTGDLHAGDAIGVAVRWQPVKDLSQRYTAFLQMLDNRDNGVAAHDSEPQAGLSPTDGWRAGSIIEDRMGLLVPVDVPSGEYRLVVGLYPTGSPDGKPRLAGRGLSGPNVTVELGSIRVEGGEVDRLRPAVHLSATLGDSLELLGYETDLDFFQTRVTRDILPMLEETITLVFPRDAYHPGETINLNLYWRTLAEVGEDYGWNLELVGEHDQVLAQAEGLFLRLHATTSAWGEDEIAVTRHTLPLAGDLRAGTYRLRLSLWAQHDSERTSVVWNENESVSLTLGEAEVR